MLEPGGAAVFVTPNRLTFARPDEIIDPYHYVEYDRARAARRCARRVFDDGARCTGCSARARYLELVDEQQRAARPRCCARTRCACGAGAPRGCASGCTTACSPGRGATTIPRAAAIRPEDFELRADGLEHCLDVVAACRVA